MKKNNTMIWVLVGGALLYYYFSTTKPLPPTTKITPTGTPVSTSSGDQSKRAYIQNYYTYYIAPGNDSTTNDLFATALGGMSSSDLNVLYTYITNYLMEPNITPPASFLAQISQVANKYGIQDLFV